MTADPIATAARDAVAWLEASTGLTLSDEERAAVAYGVRVGYTLHRCDWCNEERAAVAYGV